MQNIIKQKAFNERMGILKQKPKHMKLAKGGMVKKFAAGGATLTGPSNIGVVQNATNPNTGIAGTIGGALGLNDNYQAGAANLQNGTNAAQLNTAYTGAQTGLTNQDQLASTFSPQAGQAVANQNELANQYYNITQGGGPNPAAAQLAQATNTNVANQAAQAAAQRGASSNVGLLARQAAQTGASTQQQAIGQAATLEAQQQIAAQQNLANLSAQQAQQAQGAVGAQNTAQQGEQNILQGANTALNSTNAGMQGNINTTNAATAAANQKQSGNIVGGLASGLSGAASSIGGAISSFFNKGGEVEDHHKLAEMNAVSLKHYANGGVTIGSNPLVGDQTNGGRGPIASVGPTSVPANAPAQAAAVPNQMNPDNSGQNLSNGLSSFASALTNPGPAGSNETRDANQEYINADEALGVAGTENPEFDLPASNNDSQSLGPMQFTVGDNQIATASKGGEIKFRPHPPYGESFIVNHLRMSKGGQVPAKVSPGEIWLSPEKVKAVVHDGANPLKIGYRFPGKAKVKGDSPKNDTIPETLQDGGVVIKRSIVNKKDPEKAALFVHRAHMKGNR